MSAIQLKVSSVHSLLSIIVLQIENYDEIITQVFKEPKMQKKLSVILAIVKSKVGSMQLFDITKLIPDNDLDFMVKYLFPLIVILLKNYIHDIMIEMLDISCERSTSQEYKSFCDFSKSIVDDYKNIESVLATKGMLNKINEYKTTIQQS
jgi:hypothetical protein